jgi:hypothetical protein
MNSMKSLRFPVKGVGGLSLMFSEAFVIVAVDCSAMVSVFVVVSRFLCRYRFSVSRCQVSSSQSLEVSVYQSVKVSWYQGVRVRCKNTGAFRW